MGITANEHWTKKGEDVDLFLFEKTSAETSRGTVLFVHGSSIASTPTFDLQVPGRPGPRSWIGSVTEVSLLGV